MNTTYSTSNGERITRGQRHELLASDGTRFSGESIGVCVSKGVLFAAFVHVEGDVKTTGKKAYFNVALSDLSDTASMRPLVLGQ